jgi:phosphohistidine phosphatase
VDGHKEVADVSVWLMQHGLAEDEAVDPRKPLTAEGWRQVEAVADLLFALPERPARIVHSGKLRAQQTAEIVSAALGVPAEHHLGLDPADVVEP